MVNAEAIPPGATSRMVWQEAEAPPIEIEISDSDVHGGTGRRAELRVVLARTVMPLRQSQPVGKRKA